MAFGLTDGPPTFHSAMNTTLSPVLRVCAVVFFDDILIFIHTYEDHITHLCQVLGLLQKDHWKVKFSKCSFAQRSISYLGFVISEQGVQTDPAKVVAVQTWPQPTNLKELRGFLGLSGYYRKFVRHYGMINHSL